MALLQRALVFTVLCVVLAPAVAAQSPSTSLPQMAELLAGDHSDLQSFGWSVAISGDTAIVGAQYDDELGAFAGAAYVYVRSGKNWAQQAKLLAEDGAQGDRFGYTVAASGDTALVAALSDQGNSSVYVFVRDGTSWTQQAKLLPDGESLYSEFGFSIALSGDTTLIGAYGDNELAASAGAAYVFVRNGSSWSQQAKLFADDGVEGDSFGIAVALSGDTVTVGATNHGETGSAYVFSRNGTAWGQQAELLASDGAPGDGFGSAVALSRDTAIVAAPSDETFAGSAYVFVRGGASWVQQAKLRAEDGATDDLFGWSVALAGTTAVIGAPYADALGSASGSAYVFTRSGSGWKQRAKLLADDGGLEDQFGWSVAVSDKDVLIGAHFHDHLRQPFPAFERWGSVYVFALPRRVPIAITTLLGQDEAP